MQGSEMSKEGRKKEGKKGNNCARKKSVKGIKGKEKNNPS